jgi:cytochrome c oxidase subunit IV
MSSPRFYLLITAVLMALLGVTVGMSFVDLGPFNTVVAMLVSAGKAGLILLFFMHLRHAGPLLRLFAGVGFFWLAIMLTLALSDYLTRHS